jgi:hypothetical protein
VIVRRAGSRGRYSRSSFSTGGDGRFSISHWLSRDKGADALLYADLQRRDADEQRTSRILADVLERLAMQNVPKRLIPSLRHHLSGACLM